MPGTAGRSPRVRRSFFVSAAGQRDRSFVGGKGFVREDFGLQSKIGTEFPMVSAMTGHADSRGRPVLVAGTASVVSGCYAKSVVKPHQRDGALQWPVICSRPRSIGLTHEASAKARQAAPR
jgi:hypothetical protein